MLKTATFGIASLLFAAGCSSAEAATPPAAESTSAAAHAASLLPTRALTSTVTGLVDGVPFAGTLRITRFVAVGDQLHAIAQIVNVSGDVSADVAAAIEAETIELPVGLPGVATSACNVLDLSLGNLDLEIVGLGVHLDPVNLELEGALVGSLLCTITGLLDPGSVLSNLGTIAGLLNVVIGLIGVF